MPLVTPLNRTIDGGIVGALPHFSVENVQRTAIWILNVYGHILLRAH